MSRYLYIAALVIAGEMVFGLPFHTSRFFRPTMLDVFGFSNTQLGDLFAIYGVTAMASYFPGGAIADRFSARFLLTASLVATGCGGLYMATIPGVRGHGDLVRVLGFYDNFSFLGRVDTCDPRVGRWLCARHRIWNSRERPRGCSRVVCKSARRDIRLVHA